VCGSFGGDMDSRKEFESWFEAHTTIAGLSNSLVFKQDADGMYKDSDVFMSYRGWQARQPEIDKKDEQIKLLHEAIEQAYQRAGMIKIRAALEATKGEVMNMPFELLESIPDHVVVYNMNYTGEILNGVFNGTHYVLEDGDMYLPETIYNYEAYFYDSNKKTL
jgi:hypothetical protein